MPTDDHWITARINETRKRYPSVTEAVSDRLKELLNGQLSEHQFTQVELRKAARALIDDMAPASSKAETIK